MAGSTELEAAHLQHLTAALPGRVQADALKGALSLHRPLGRRRVIVPAHDTTPVVSLQPTKQIDIVSMPLTLGMSGFEKLYNSFFKANDIVSMSFALKQLLWSFSHPLIPIDAVLAEARGGSNCTQVTSHLQPHNNAKTGRVKPHTVDMLLACG